MAKKLLTIIVPVYQNEGSLQPTYIKFKGVLADLKQKYDYEFIFINDGSTDGSERELNEIRKIDSKVRVINFTRNFGQISAWLAGFEAAKGDVLINISADMQDPPELSKEMLEKWEAGSKVVACERANREDSFTSRMTSKIFYGLIRISQPRMPVGGFDYYLLDRDVFKKIVDLKEHNSFVQGDILWFGYEPYFIKYKREKRKIGKSQWTFFKKLKYFIDGLIYTSYLPIRFMSILGIFISLCGLLYALLVVILWFLKETPFTGYAPIIIIQLVVSGMIMVMLGVIGEYLWRTYDKTRGRPLYVIRDKSED